MGCAASKLDQLPAVSLCRDRCHFLNGTLQQSYALADAHVAYMQSFKTLGHTLRHFFDLCVKSTSGDDSAVKPPKQSSPPSSPDHSLSSSNSDSHIQFDTDLEEEETDTDFGSSFNQINTTSYHNYQPNKYQNSEFIGSGWKTPPPPAPRSAAWEYLNFFDELYERYELPYSPSKATKNKEASHDLEAHPVNQILGDDPEQIMEKQKEKKIRAEKLFH